MTISPKAIAIVWSCLVLSAATAAAQNNTSTTAAHLMPGQPPVKVDIDLAPNNFRWYDFQGRAGRSYCVEATTYETETRQTDPRVDCLQEWHPSGE